jgi:hypothetical protein
MDAIVLVMLRQAGNAQVGAMLEETSALRFVEMEFGWANTSAMMET